MDIYCVYDNKIIRKHIKKINNKTTFTINPINNETLNNVKLYDLYNEYDIDYIKENDKIKINSVIDKHYIILEYISNSISWYPTMKIYICERDILFKLYAHFNITNDNIDINKKYKEVRLYTNNDEYKLHDININNDTKIVLNESRIIKNYINYHIYRTDFVCNKYNCILNYNIPNCKVFIYNENVDLVNEINTIFLPKNIEFSFIGDIDENINIIYDENYNFIECNNNTDNIFDIYIEFEKNINISDISIINCINSELYEENDDNYILKLKINN